METIEKLPEQKAVIGTREIIKAAKAGKVKLVVIASNCPQFLVDRVLSSTAGIAIQVKKISGDQADLGTRLGKPFAVAMAGYQ